jgi:hypothetical protein
MQFADETWICEGWSGAPCHAPPAADIGPDDFGNAVAGSVGGILDTVDQLTPDDFCAPTFNPNPRGACHPVDIHDNPTSDPYEAWLRSHNLNPNSDAYTIGELTPLLTSASGAKLATRTGESIATYLSRRSDDIAETATKTGAGARPLFEPNDFALGLDDRRSPQAVRAGERNSVLQRT